MATNSSHFVNAITPDCNQPHILAFSWISPHKRVCLNRSMQDLPKTFL